MLAANDLLQEFVEGIERARGRINDPISARNKSLLSRPLATGKPGRVFALLDEDNVWNGPFVLRPPVGSSGDILDVYNRVDGSLAFNVDLNGQANFATGLTFWPSGAVGTGNSGTFGAASFSQSRSLTLPDTSGTVAINAGTLNRLNSTTAATTVSFLSTANAPAGIYIVSAYLYVGNTTGNRVISVTVNWNDGTARTFPVASALSLASSANFAQVTFPVYTAGATALTYTVVINSGTTGNYSLRLRATAIG